MKLFILVLKSLLLAVIMFVCVAAASSVVRVHGGSGNTGGALQALLIYCLLNTAVLVMFINGSRLTGFKLIGTAALVLFGIQSFMTQIETLYFNSAVKMPFAEIIKTVGMGAIVAVLFSAVAVPILNRFKKGPATADHNKTIKGLSIAKAIPGMIILTIAYILIYFLFGYFVAWQFSDVRVFYTGSTELLSAFGQYSNILHNDPLLLIFQILRGALWAGLALLIYNSLNAKKIAVYAISALLFGVLISSQLLFPNPYMPDSVRLGHTYELFSSMALFGIISVLIFNKVKSKGISSAR